MTLLSTLSVFFSVSKGDRARPQVTSDALDGVMSSQCKSWTSVDIYIAVHMTNISISVSDTVMFIFYSTKNCGSFENPRPLWLFFLQASHY